MRMYSSATGAMPWITVAMIMSAYENSASRNGPPASPSRSACSPSRSFATCGACSPTFTPYLRANQPVPQRLTGRNMRRTRAGTPGGIASSSAPGLCSIRVTTSARPCPMNASDISLQRRISATFAAGSSGAPWPIRSACAAISHDSVNTVSPSISTGTVAGPSRRPTSFRSRRSPITGTCVTSRYASP